jgi:CRISPR-associated protein Cmr4
MFSKAAMLYLYTETSLHAGSGASIGGVDLPVQREKSTRYPMIQASGVKGALRHLAEMHWPVVKNKPATKTTPTLPSPASLVEVMFGPAEESASEYAGALAFTDARILLFPVRSITGVFAWATCPMVIERFKRDCGRLEKFSPSANAPWPALNPLSAMTAFTTKESKVVTNNQSTSEGYLVLEDYSLKVQSQDATLTAFATWLGAQIWPTTNNSDKSVNDQYQFWRDRLKECLVVVSDDVFSHFVQFSTEVLFRIRIGETGTVAEGALWSEERVPSDALFYVLTLAAHDRSKWAIAEPETPPQLEKTSLDKEATKIMNDLGSLIDQHQIVQIGGNETVGCGLVRARLIT